MNDSKEAAKRTYFCEIEVVAGLDENNNLKALEKYSVVFKNSSSCREMETLVRTKFHNVRRSIRAVFEEIKSQSEDNFADRIDCKRQLFSKVL